MPVTEKKTRGRSKTEERSDDILKAAFDIFSEAGFQAARMENIAARAGVTKGLIYFYFKNKQELFEAVFRECVKEPIVGALLRVNPAESMAGHLALIMAELYDKVVSTPFFARMIRLILLEGQSFPDFQAAYLREVITPLMTAMRSVLEEGSRRGEWSADAVPEFLHVLIAPVLLFTLWRDGLNRYMPLETVPFCRDHQKMALRSLGLGPQEIIAALALADNRTGNLFTIGVPVSPNQPPLPVWAPDLKAASGPTETLDEGAPPSRNGQDAPGRRLFTARAARRRGKR